MAPKGLPAEVFARIKADVPMIPKGTASAVPFDFQEMHATAWLQATASYSAWNLAATKSINDLTLSDVLCRSA